jgi:hypothetical protein
MPVERATPKLRLGILLDSNFVSKYIVDFIHWSRSHTHLELVEILIARPREGTSTSSPTYNVASSLGRLFFNFTVVIERLFLLKNKTHYDHLRKLDLSSLSFGDVVRIWRLDDHKTANVQDLDVLISFMAGPIDEIFFTIARLGVIALTYSDDQIYRGGPAGFWEVYNHDDVTGFSIECQTATRINRTLLRGRTATQFYYLLNQGSLFEKSHHYLKTVTEKIAATGTLPDPEPQLPFGRQPTGIPKPQQTLLYLAGLTNLIITKLLQKAGFENQWHVAFLRTDWRNAELWRAVTIHNPSQHYLADPFVITEDGKDYCFVEDYDTALKRGKIAVYELGIDKATYIGVALQEDFHLSYPYLFRYEGQLYMCPETSAAGDIRIYKCQEFPLHWQCHKILMSSVSAVDTMVFESNGKWWMLTNIDPAGWGDFSLELHIFSANSPLEQNWAPHPGNPFLLDASCTRNGGITHDDGRVFRIAQRQGFSMYGKQTTVNEIVELTESSYVERRVCEIPALFKKGIRGTHHLHSNGKVTVFDFASR